jgi:hypothetical protein
MSIQLELPAFTEDAPRVGEASARVVNVVRDLADYGLREVGARKPATPAKPSPRSDLRRLAIRRIQRLAAFDEGWDRKADPDPVHDVDHRTSMSDARIALCAARGVALDDIDPTTGHDISRPAYERSRSEWRRHIEQQGWDVYTAAQYAEVRARWEARRPEWVADDDWLAGLTGVEDARQALDEARARIRKAVEETR